MQVETNHLEVVFLDAVGTLFEVRGSVGEIYSTIARRHGVDTCADVLQAAFVEAFRRKSLDPIPPANSRHRLMREREWWLEIVRQVFSGRMTPAALLEYFEEVFEVFRTAAAWRLFPEVSHCLDRLHSAGYRLGIISNFDSRLLDLLDDLGIGSQFEHVTISWAAGAAKPDARIFRSALEAMNVLAGHALHVGDSLKEDFAGARGSGIQAVWLDRGDTCPMWADGPRIQSLSDLFEILPSKSER